MWRSMYECHQEQTRIVQQLQHLCAASAAAIPVAVVPTTSDVHRHAALQLEHEVERWHSSFCNLVKSQRDYIAALAGWLRLSSHHHRFRYSVPPNSELVLSLCDKWQLALDRIPDKVASEGIKSFLTVVHAVVVQQAEEKKRKKTSDFAFKELERRAAELRALETKYDGGGPYSPAPAVVEKRVKVERLKAKAEEEKQRHEKCAGVTRAMTMNNLRTGLPHVVQAVAGFAGVSAQAFRAVLLDDQGSVGTAAPELKRLQLPLA